MIEYAKKLNSILKKLGYKFINNDLLILAVTHSSHDKIVNNQRLEFLGDSILSFVIAEYLYNQPLILDEGNLTRIRSNLVKKETLAAIARKYSINQVVILGDGELKTAGYNKDSILADTLEAIIAAIYLDSDILTITKLIIDWYQSMGYLQAVNNFLTDHQQLKLLASFKDPKTILQEMLHSKGYALPIYKVVKITGKPHHQTFTVSCLVPNIKEIIYGIGSSRKKAEQDAATKILGLLSE